MYGIELGDLSMYIHTHRHRHIHVVLGLESKALCIPAMKEYKRYPDEDGTKIALRYSMI
jgi:hypothetical protein